MLIEFTAGYGCDGHNAPPFELICSNVTTYCAIRQENISRAQFLDRFLPSDFIKTSPCSFSILLNNHHPVILPFLRSAALLSLQIYLPTIQRAICSGNTLSGKGRKLAMTTIGNVMLWLIDHAISHCQKRTG